MYKSQKIGASISRELLVFKKDHLKPTQFKRRSNFYNKLLKYLTGIISWEMKICFFLYLIYIWITNLFQLLNWTKNYLRNVFPNMIFLTSLSCIIISFVTFADHHLEYHFTKLFISFPKASLGPLIFRIFPLNFKLCYHPCWPFFNWLVSRLAIF